MKNLRLAKLRLFSMSEAASWNCEFHPRTTLILGPNHTGKSSVLKSLYHTFGANVELHPTWKEANVGSLIEFDLDDEKYSILRYADKFATFDSNGNLLGRFKRITSELGPHLAQLFNFNLRLKDKNFIDQTLPPSFLFMPFYLDQDKGWLSAWNSFGSLLQFPKWKASLIPYHTGIRPQQYYDLQVRIADIGLKLKELKAKRDVLSELILRLASDVKILFDYDLESFSKEISDLLIQCNRIRESQNELREILEELYGRKAVLMSQLGIADRAIRENKKDFDYATLELPDDSINCPTCGHQYLNNFSERFAIAVDQDSYFELKSELQDELDEVNDKIKQQLSRFASEQVRETRILRILETKQGEVELNDLIENEGRKKGEQTIQNNIDAVDSEMNHLLAEDAQLREQVKSYESKTRKQEIVSLYSSQMRRYVELLDVKNLPEINLTKIDGPMKDQGSGNPRAILCYFYAILQVVKKYSSSTFCPIIIDSPQQQDQDKFHLPKVLEFIRDERPLGSQLILGMTDSQNVDFKDSSTITLGNKWHLLQTDSYEETMDEVRPYLNALLAY